MTGSDASIATLTIEDDHLLVRGAGVATDRRARLFFRTILGARPLVDGWQCPRRRLSTKALLLRAYDWLQEHGYEIRGETALVDQTVSRELERRRSFIRTREAAQALQGGASEFDFAPVDSALASFGWSDSRTLRPHQREGVAHALTAVNAANFSVPGSGKTTTVLAVAATHFHSDTIDLVVVIGPLASFHPWEQETETAVGSAIRTRRVRGNARARQEAYARTRRRDLLLLSYATAAADQLQLIELFESFRVMLVVDESHRVKRFRGGVWAPALVELASRARVRLVLSGTPMPQSGRDLFNQLNILWPDHQLTGTPDAFAARVENNFSTVVAHVVPFVSRTPKSALGLSPPRVLRHEVPISGVQAEIYELIANRFRQQLEDSETWRAKLESLRRARPIRLLQAATNPGLLNLNDSYFGVPRVQDRSLTLMERLAGYDSHETPAKSEAGLKLVEEIAREGGKVVCWSNFVANLDHFSGLVRKRLRLPCFQIDGRVPAGHDALHIDAQAETERAGDIDTREEAIHRFLTTEGPSVLVTNPASCSESISLHQTCHNAIYLDRTYDCALFLQSIDRIHRLGLPPDAKVTVHILLASYGGEPTIDALVDESLEAKSDKMRELLEGAELTPANLSSDPATDAEGDEHDLARVLRYLLGEDL